MTPVLPELDADNREFWQAGSQGELRFQHCAACDRYLHPPGPVCPACYSRDIRYRAVSGRAEVFSFTLNYQAWHPDMQVPLAIAIVELAEQAGLRLTTNIVGCNPQDVHIGMQVQVQFRQVDDIWLPLFRPAA